MTSGIYTPADKDVTPSGHGPSAIGSADVAREVAVESFAHMVASLVHAAMGHKHVTVDALKERLAELGHPSTLFVDHVLAAHCAHLVRLSQLSDIAHVLDVSIDLTVTSLQREALAEAPSSAEGVDNKDRAP